MGGGGGEGWRRGGGEEAAGGGARLHTRRGGEGPRKQPSTHAARKAATFWGTEMPSTCSALAPSREPTPQEKSLGCASGPARDTRTTSLSALNTPPRCSTLATRRRRAASMRVRNWFCASADSGQKKKEALPLDTFTS